MQKPFSFGIFFFIVKLSVFGQTNDWKTIETEIYSIQYPNEWVLDESGRMGTSFILFSPQTSENDRFKENVNLLVQDLSGYNLSLEKYVEISESQIETMITDAVIIESTLVNSQPWDYQKAIYTGKQGVFNLKFEQYYWVVADMAYVLTLTCEETQYNNYKIIGEEILNSFQLH